MFNMRSPDARLGLRLDSALLAELDELADRFGLSRSALVRLALKQSLSQLRADPGALLREAA